MRIVSPIVLLALTASAAAQTVTQIPLNYNFNGIVHSGEAGNPDDLNGYRSISDRGLDFSAGIPTNPLVAAYSLVATAGTLDVVHIGNRNTVDGGARAFGVAPDGDDFGVQPTWLASPDQTGPQTTTLPSPIALQGTSSASFLLQVSNGGGSVDVGFTFQSGASTIASISAGDWFGGGFAGTGATDNAAVDNNLSITEFTVDLSAFDGETLTAIAFANASNTNAGYAILAANVSTDLTPTSTTQIPLDYNFNGIVHAGESGVPDDATGYRSISDRGLDFTAGVPSNPLSDDFLLVDMAGALDIVHLGDRNVTDNGNRPWDPSPDGDDIGIQPSWLPNSDQTGPQTTILGTPITLDSSSSAAVLFQISNGGGAFDVTFGFQSGGSTTSTLFGSDWFGGSFAGTAGVDSGFADANLNLTIGTVDLSASAGEVLTSISFDNSLNPNSAVAILAANVDTTGLGSNYCSTNPNSAGLLGTMGATGSNVVASNDLTITASQLPPNQFGIFVTSMTQAFVPLGGGSTNGNICLGGAIGRFSRPGEILATGATGSFSLALDLTDIPQGNGTVAVMPGQTWNFQAWHRDGVGLGSNFTDGIAIAFQ